jgi:hypothetical protein
MDSADPEDSIARAWPQIVDECRAVLGGELHYQAIVYHCLRNAGWPRTQIGMNVKQMIEDPVTAAFKAKGESKHIDFRGGFEPIPDLVLFSPEISGDWRRRNWLNTIRYMRCAIEVKASERANSRLGPGEIKNDIAKLVAHRKELQHRGFDMLPVMMVIDVAPLRRERMLDYAVTECAKVAAANAVAWLYATPELQEISFNN